MFPWREPKTKVIRITEKVSQTVEDEMDSIFSTGVMSGTKRQLKSAYESVDRLIEKGFSEYNKHIPAESKSMRMAMDSSISTVKTSYENNTSIPDNQVCWYTSQSFIGHQMCALLSQNWLVSKACQMTAKDATRNGFEITVNDGSEVAP